jgi:NAD(P)-dependent dehydrogenase (short-subunit alcohol dehydrogenase family)
MKAFAELWDKRVFVTGAASGIGYELALAFAAQGADIVAADISDHGLQRLVQQIEATGGHCRPVVLDVTDEEAFNSLFREMASGGALPDIVINNAGIGFLGGFTQTDTAIWRRILDINVLGVANGCRAYLTARADSGSSSNTPGLLINVASAASIAPMPNMSAYAASKYAVEGLSEVLAMELEDSAVDVMTVHPGVINTPIVSDRGMSRVSEEQLDRLQVYYAENGNAPALVAQQVVAGVKAGKSAVFAGDAVGVTALLKRLLSRRGFRSLLASKAREIGYL